MSESWGNPELAAIFGGKNHAYPTSKSRRRSAYIYRHVEYLTGGYPYQFALRLLYLVMQTAQDPASRTGMVVLHEPVGLADRGFECILIITFEEEAACVPKHSWFKKEDVGNGSLFILHQNTFSWSTD